MGTFISKVGWRIEARLPITWESTWKGLRIEKLGATHGRLEAMDKNHKIELYRPDDTVNCGEEFCHDRDPKKQVGSLQTLDRGRLLGTIYSSLVFETVEFAFGILP